MSSDYSLSFGPSPFWLRLIGRLLELLRPLLTSRSSMRCRPFRHEARSPQVRTQTFIAQPPHLRRFALVTRASRFDARSPCLAAPSMQFLSIGSRFTLHASSPHSVTLMQLRFTSLTVTSSWRDLHPQVCAHAGRTSSRNPHRWGLLSQNRTCAVHIRLFGTVGYDPHGRPVSDLDYPKTSSC